MVVRSDEKVVLSSDVVPEHYDLELSPNFEGEFIYPGTVSIFLELKSDSISSITLHSKQLTIINATFTQNNISANSAVTATQIVPDEAATTATINFPQALPKGKGCLKLEFTGCHNNQMAGFYRSNYVRPDGTKGILLSTQFEPLDARRCFPCVDEPNVKATFSSTLIIDDLAGASKLTALSNMPVQSEESLTINGKAKIKVKFETTPRMSTYLLAFAVGELEYVEKVSKNGKVLLRVYTVPGKKADGIYALNVCGESLDLYDQRFGIEFPLPKMDMIAIPEFAMGAMENWGLVTYREVDLLIDEKKASSQQKQRVCEVVCHELAHQWFGNLVTMNWWDDLWLNEGFASWMQNYSTEFINPDWQMWEQFVVDQQSQALNMDSLISSHPIQVPIKHAEEVEEVFDVISYRKGACVVRLIYALLGEEVFFNGLKLYMEKHQYKNTETYDLWQAWETASKNVPIKAILQSWTEQMGYPLLTVKSVTDKSGKRHISVDQRWYLADGQKLEPANLWQIPMFVTTSSGTKPLELMTSKERTYEIDSGKFFKLNGGQDILMRVNYPRSVWLDLIAAVKEGNLGIQDRTGLLNDAYALAKSGDLEADVLLMLIQGYENEDTYPVWSALGGSLSGLHKILTEDDLQREQLENLGKRLVLKLFNRVGWKSTESDGHLGKLLRALCIGLLETFCADDAVILGECRSLFKSYIEAVQKSEFEEASRVLPSEYRQSVFRVVLKAAEGREELDMLLDSLKKIESIAERKPIYLSLGFVKREDLKKEVLEWAVAGPSEGHVKLQDFFYVIASVSFSGVVGLRITWEYLKENFDEKYVPMLSAASPSLLAAVVMYSGSGFTTEDKAQEIKDFFAQNNRTNKIQRKVEQMVEATNNNAQFRLKLLKNTKFTEYLATV